VGEGCEVGWYVHEHSGVMLEVGCVRWMDGAWDVGENGQSGEVSGARGKG
jgi:hypothetical protein